jgi:hypothetical protein
MALKLLQALPASSSSAGFKVVVAALPQQDKARLQSALKESATAAAAGGPGAAGVGGAGGTAAAVKKPTIALKMNFALPATQGQQGPGASAGAAKGS